MTKTMTTRNAARPVRTPARSWYHGPALALLLAILGSSGRALAQDADVLIRQLDAPVAHERAMAACELARMGASAVRVAMPRLLDLLADDTPVEGRLGRDGSAWRNGRHEDSFPGREAAIALEEAGAEAIEPLAEILAAGPLSGAPEDEDEDVRERAMWALGRVVRNADSGSIDTRELARRLRRSHDGAQDEVVVQSDAAEFARHLRVLRIDTSDTQALISGLHAQSPLTRGASAWALGKSDDPVVIDPLIQASYDTNARVRQWAVRSLARWDASRVTDTLTTRLRDGDAEVRQWTVRALAGRDSPVARQALIHSLGDPDVEVREWAVRGLSEIRDIRITESLIPMLQDDDAEVREWSVRALAYCGNQRAVAALQVLRDDPDEDVREWVERALEAIDCR